MSLRPLYDRIAVKRIEERENRASVFRRVREAFTQSHREDRSMARLEFEIGPPRRENSGDA